MSLAPWPNLVSMFFEQAEKKGDAPFLWQKGEGTYTPTSWNDAAKTVRTMARALMARGIEKGDRIVLVCENRTEWALADLAIMAAGGVTVPAYTTNTTLEHTHILTNSEARAAIVSNAKLADALLPATHSADLVEFVISIEPLHLQQELSHPVLEWETLLESEEITELPYKDLSPDDTACIIYTSGTGGTPKGVMLPHRSILHNCVAATEILKELGLEQEVFLSFLPLSHSYEHTAGLMWPIFIGAEIYYAEGADTLLVNMQEARPTLMTAVPRLYEMMRQRILRAVEKEGGTKEKFFKSAVKLGTQKHLGQSLGLLGFFENKLLDIVVRKKVKQRFGGRLKAMVSGGGPLNPDVGHFFQGLGINILQGYGQTESGPVISVNIPSNIKMQTVGPALPNTEVKIAEDGEILVRGDLLMQGYWRNPKATQSTIMDGWLHTGDIGFLDKDNFLQITDRKKDIIVNSGGDNISPQRVEGFLALEQEIAQSMVYGDRKPHLVALIVPDEEEAHAWARQQGLEPSLHDLVHNSNFQQHIAATVNRVNKNLSKLETVRKFILTAEPFSLENKQMTPTLKIRRHVIKEHYEAALLDLY